MARPATKKDLIIAAQTQFTKLWDIINSMTEAEQKQTFNFEDRDKNVRDVLIHLFEWHQLLLNWTRDNRNGKSVSFLPEPYNWKTYPQMNIEIWQRHQNTPYEKSREMFNESYTEVIDLIESFSDEELFVKKYFAWTGTTSLGAYFVSATSSHYDWAIKKIRTHIKTK